MRPSCSSGRTTYNSPTRDFRCIRELARSIVPLPPQWERLGEGTRSHSDSTLHGGAGARAPGERPHPRPLPEGEGISDILDLTTRVRNDMPQKVGFIGLGSMGRPFASNIAQAGFDLIVYDVRPEPMADLVKLGARAAGSAREVAEHADMVDVAVSGGPAVDAVMQGPDGVLAGAHPGLIAVIHTSIYPTHMQSIAHDAKAHGIELLDAQMSGGWTSAVERKLCLMVGGDASLLERCRPVWETTATNIFRVGDVGMGAGAKIAQNVIT